MCDPLGLGMEWLRACRDGLLSQGEHDHHVPGCVGRPSVVVYTLIRTALPVGYTWAHNFCRR
jgi:hypothetical protein